MSCCQPFVSSHLFLAICCYLTKQCSVTSFKWYIYKWSLYWVCTIALSSTIGVRYYSFFSWLRLSFSPFIGNQYPRTYLSEHQEESENYARNTLNRVRRFIRLAQFFLPQHTIVAYRKQNWHLDTAEREQEGEMASGTLVENQARTKAMSRKHFLSWHWRT